MNDVKCPECGCQFDSSENPATESESGEQESGEIELKLPEKSTSWFGPEKRFGKK